MPILTTSGVIRVLGIGTEPVPIPDKEIEDVEAALQSGLAMRACPFLRKGQLVRVTRGSLKGIEGFLLRQKSEWRLIISVNMLQRSISLEINRDWITAK